MNTISQTMKNHAKPIFHGFLLVLSLVIFSNSLFGAVNPETLTVTIDSVEEFPKEGHVVSLESPIPLYATFLGSKLKITRSLFYDGKKTPAVSWLAQGQILKEISGYGESSASSVTASATTTALGAEPLKARAKNSDGSLTDSDVNAILIVTLDTLTASMRQNSKDIQKTDADSSDDTPKEKTLYCGVPNRWIEMSTPINLVNLKIELSDPVNKLHPYVFWKIVKAPEKVTFDATSGVFDENGESKFKWGNKLMEEGDYCDIVAWTDLDGDDQISSIEQQSKRMIRMEFISVSNKKTPSRYFAESKLDLPIVFKINTSPNISDIPKSDIEKIKYEMRCKIPQYDKYYGCDCLLSDVFAGDLIQAVDDTTPGTFTLLVKESEFDPWLLLPSTPKSFNNTNSVGLTLKFSDGSNYKYEAYSAIRPISFLEYGDIYNEVIDIGIPEEIDIKKETPKQCDMVNEKGPNGFSQVIEPGFDSSADTWEDGSSYRWTYAAATQTEGWPYKLHAQLTSEWADYRSNPYHS